MRRHLIGVAVIAAVLAAAPRPASAQRSRCVECHFANFLDVPGREHLGEWEQSAHARHDVGCEWCHGGDASTFVPANAHKGVLGSSNPASRVYRANLPATCSTCHAGETRAFSRSTHNQLLQRGDPDAPTCASCHGAMTARVPSPAALESRCAACHPPASPTAAYPALARVAIEEIASIRRLLIDSQLRLQKMPDATDRRRLWAQHVLAVATLNSAIDAFHSFDFEATAERLRAARARAAEMDRQTK
jgi:hypothetical protein